MKDHRGKYPAVKRWLALMLGLTMLLAACGAPIREGGRAELTSRGDASALSGSSAVARPAASAGEMAEAEDAAASFGVLRIGYVEGEAYYEFDEALYYLILGLEEYSLVPPFREEPPFGVSSRQLWTWLSGQDQSGWRVQFVEEAFYALDSEDYAGWSEEEKDRMLTAGIAVSGVDMLFAMGTTAGLAVRRMDPPVPMMSFCSADPVKSGIVNSAEVSGVADVWAQTDPDAFARSILVMNDILQPRKVGVVYADNREAYIYSGVDELDRLAAELGFAVIREYVDDPGTASPENMQAYYENLAHAYRRLAEEVDAFIMTTSLIELEDMQALLQPFYERNVPIYSINTTEDVQYGALLGAQSTDYRNGGRFGADMLGRYMAGEKLEALPQIYRTAPYLVINYGVARKIGYRPSFAMLLSAHKIYP